MVMRVNGTEIDGLSQEVLRELDNSEDGVLNTVELRKRLKMNGGEIEDGERQNLNRKVKYRFEKLESAELADVREGGKGRQRRDLAEGSGDYAKRCGVGGPVQPARWRR
jgi:hypothetical protein